MADLLKIYRVSRTWFCDICGRETACVRDVDGLELCPACEDEMDVTTREQSAILEDDLFVSGG